MGATTVVTPRLFRIGAAARELGVHPGSLRRAEREGRIRPARREAVSGERFYSEEDLQEIRYLLFRRLASAQ
jgi:DNA-binding transcriptional MerR regulator